MLFHRCVYPAYQSIGEMARNSLLVLYDDVTTGDRPARAQLVYEFTKFASRNDDLKDATFVPISKFLDDPHEYRHHLKASGLAFRFYGEIPRRMYRDELKLRETFWKELLVPSYDRSQDFYSGRRFASSDWNESILAVHKALSEWAKLSNVPAPEATNPRYPYEPGALVVHLCTIVNIDGFTDLVKFTDVDRARTLIRENEDDENATSVTAVLQRVRVKSMSFVMAAPNKKAEPQVFRTIDYHNNQNARKLLTDYEDKWDFEVLRRNQTVNSSAEVLRQMISVGIVETDPYRQGFLGSGAQRQGPDTPWNKFVGRDQYDPRLFLEIWKFVYSTPAAAAPNDEDAPDSPKRK